uniref:Tyrosine-protein phosphatase domain-containing protein n=1 Tax=Syphacia muris TaxID=451379 RepID=A0A0N5AMG4_9BILA
MCIRSDQVKHDIDTVMQVSNSKTGIAEMEERLFEQITTLRKVRALRPYGMCKILNNLYLGSIFDATDPEQMAANEVTDIICVHGMRQTNYGKKQYNVMYININDSPNEDISMHFGNAVQFIHMARMQNRTVLVHCLAGVSRSAIIVAAYLLTVTNLNYSLALTYLTKRRPCTNPNFGFRMQLYHYSGGSMKAVRKKLIEVFGKSAMEEQKQIDHAAIMSLSDSVTRAGLVKEVNEEDENNDIDSDICPAVKNPDTDDSFENNSLVPNFKDLCFIDD